MNFPEKNSRSETILKTFLEKGTMTIWQGTEAHGNFANPRRPHGVDHEKVLELYCDLVERGCLVKEGIVYRLTLRAKYHMERQQRAPEPVSIVPPRIRDMFTKAISIGSTQRNPWRLAL